MRQRHDLGTVGIHAYYAGQYRGMREAWLAAARYTKANGGLRETYVSFARSAHRAHMKALLRALALHREYVHLEALRRAKVVASFPRKVS